MIHLTPPINIQGLIAVQNILLLKWGFTWKWKCCQRKLERAWGMRWRSEASVQVPAQFHEPSFSSDPSAKLWRQVLSQSYLKQQLRACIFIPQILQTLVNVHKFQLSLRSGKGSPGNLGACCRHGAGCYLIKLNMSIPYAPAIPMVWRFTRKILPCLDLKMCIKCT